MQSKSSIKQKLLLIVFGLFIALLLTEGFFRIARLIVHEENILPSEKKDNTYRILCIGDSSTYGLGSTDSEKYSYPAQLHTLFNTRLSNVNHRFSSNASNSFLNFLIMAAIGKLTA